MGIIRKCSKIFCLNYLVFRNFGIILNEPWFCSFQLNEHHSNEVNHGSVLLFPAFSLVSRLQFIWLHYRYVSVSSLYLRPLFLISPAQKWTEKSACCSDFGIQFQRTTTTRVPLYLTARRSASERRLESLNYTSTNQDELYERQRR